MNAAAETKVAPAQTKVGQLVNGTTVYLVTTNRVTMIATRKNGKFVRLVSAGNSKNGPDCDVIKSIIWDDSVAAHDVRCWLATECEIAAADSACTGSAREWYARCIAALRGLPMPEISKAYQNI
jgi:hypothetical protein